MMSNLKTEETYKEFIKSSASEIKKEEGEDEKVYKFLEGWAIESYRKCLTPGVLFEILRDEPRPHVVWYKRLWRKIWR